MSEFKVGRTALIDGDIIVYTAAASAQSHQLDEKELEDRIKFDLADWTERAACTDHIVCLSGPRDANFRREVYPLYKANRPDERPEFHGMATSIIRSAASKIFEREILEADDCMGLLATLMKGDEPLIVNPVIVTIDKDLRTVLGWHFNPNKEDFPVFVDQQAADRQFITQWMTGDSSDGYGGINRFGPKGAEKLLDETPYEQWVQVAMEKYAAHSKGYDWGYCLAMARCARILTAANWDTKKKEPVLWTPSDADIKAAELEWWLKAYEQAQQDAT